MANIMHTAPLALNGGIPVRAEPLHVGETGGNYIGKEELAELTDVISERSPFRYYGPGNPTKVAELEELFRQESGCKFALGVTSGTAALHVGLAGLGIGPGDEVILPCYTWISCFTAIVQLRALPVFVEVDGTLALDPSDVEAKITPRTKAIMAVHFQGVAAEMDPILEIASRHDLLVLEDTAQSCGASLRGSFAGSMGDVGTFSLQMGKIVTSGEGGMVITDDPGIYERACRYHDLGMLRAPHLEAIGGESQVEDFCGNQYRMNELSGAVGLAQFRKLETIKNACNSAKYRVRKQIDGLNGITLREVPDPEGDVGIEERVFLDSPEMAEGFHKALSAEGIPCGASTGSYILYTREFVQKKRTLTGRGYPFETPDGQAMEYGLGLCPKTEEMMSRGIVLPIGSKFTDSDADDIIAAFLKVHSHLIG
ncbi:MAG: DegT/DnrJ/EryC1/StrS family aminotransferase [Candidatus Latescibacteria bacterium]|nr:DegT/DnrJ/EryC1/StrS family aminotransferase [Candidatus Latescibacterota bacterium]